MTKVLIFSFLTGITACSVASVSGAADRHVMLARDSALTLTQVIDHTAANQPDARAVAAQEQLSTAERHHADRLIPESAALGLNYQSDHAVDRIGLEQQEVALKLPLWRWGERASSQQWADARTRESELLLRQFRWQLAGRVRDALWTLRQAEQALENSRAQRQILGELNGQAQQQLRAGEISRHDAMLVEQDLVEAEQSVLADESDMLDAQRSYRALTGLDTTPVDFIESQSAQHELTPQHPALALAGAQVDVAQRELDKTRYQADSRPTLTLNVKRERAENYGPITDSTGVAIEWPLDIGGRREVRNASANLALTTAQVAQQNLLRELQAQYHEAVHQLHVIHERFANAERSHTLAEQQWRMQQQAFRSGEIGMQELLLTQRRYFANQASFQQMRIEQGRAIARFNQVTGVIP